MGYQGRTVAGQRYGASNVTSRDSAERLVASAIRSSEDLCFLDTVYMASLPFFIYYSVVHTC